VPPPPPPPLPEGRKRKVRSQRNKKFKRKKTVTKKRKFKENQSSPFTSFTLLAPNGGNGKKKDKKNVFTVLPAKEGSSNESESSDSDIFSNASSSSVCLPSDSDERRSIIRRWNRRKKAHERRVHKRLQRKVRKARPLCNPKSKSILSRINKAYGRLVE